VRGSWRDGGDAKGNHQSRGTACLNRARLHGTRKKTGKKKGQKSQKQEYVLWKGGAGGRKEDAFHQKSQMERLGGKKDRHQEITVWKEGTIPDEKSRGLKKGDEQLKGRLKEYRKGLVRTMS